MISAGDIAFLIKRERRMVNPVRPASIPLGHDLKTDHPRLVYNVLGTSTIRWNSTSANTLNILYLISRLNLQYMNMEGS